MIVEDSTKLDGPSLAASTKKDHLTRGSFRLSGEEFGGITMVFNYAVRTVETPAGFSSGAQVTQEGTAIQQYPNPSFQGLRPTEALAEIRPLLFDAAAAWYRKMVVRWRKTQARRERERSQQELPCPGGC